jgi:hypothetical protein
MGLGGSRLNGSSQVAASPGCDASSGSGLASGFHICVWFEFLVFADFTSSISVMLISVLSKYCPPHFPRDAALSDGK